MLKEIEVTDDSNLRSVALRHLRGHHGRIAFLGDELRFPGVITFVAYDIHATWPQFDESGEEPVLMFPHIEGLGFVFLFRFLGHWYIQMPERGESSRLFELKRFRGEVKWPK